jgi:hypothetical protein
VLRPPYVLARAVHSREGLAEGTAGLALGACCSAVLRRGVASLSSIPAGHSADPCRGDRRKQRLGVGIPRRALPRLLSPSCHAVPLAARPS